MHLSVVAKQGRTRALNFFRVGAPPGKLVVVDAPGYGARGRPEWGELFDKYLETRKEYMDDPACRQTSRSPRLYYIDFAGCTSSSMPNTPSMLSTSKC
jgi:hypothetical protein